jgi:hypothetical protein
MVARHEEGTVFFILVVLLYPFLMTKSSVRLLARR